MLCSDVIKAIESVYPTKEALSFDNVGLLAGRCGKEVRKVYLALDATEAVIDHAIEFGADMLITHHPLIFTPLKKVTDEDFVSRRVVKLLQNDISYYAMHTNYDVLGMAGLAEKIFELEDAQVLDVTSSDGEGAPLGIGRIGTLKNPMSLKECCAYVRHKLKLEHVKVFGDVDRQVSRVAVCPGSGKSVIGCAVELGADVLVTGDIGHHEGIDAVERGLSVIDAGHYGTEYIFLDDMKQFIERELASLELKAEPVSFPFQIV